MKLDQTQNAINQHAADQLMESPLSGKMVQELGEIIIAIFQRKLLS